jgi:hypothetical protein
VPAACSRPAIERAGHAISAATAYASCIGDKLALLNDSELSRLPATNARRSPYFGANILPPKVTMIHARGNDPQVMSNMLIRYCD